LSIKLETGANKTLVVSCFYRASVCLCMQSAIFI